MTPPDEPLSRDHILVEDDRTGTSQETLRRAVLDNLFYIQGKFPEIATRNDYYMALAYTVRDRLLYHWAKTVETWLQKDVKIVCYLSAEFLLGPHLGNNLINLGIEDPVRQAVGAVGQNLDELLQQEEEPGLGNGGLGRLAACYMDSLATLEVPAIGFGIRYEHGIFHQEIRDGWQMEMTDNWLHLGNPWEIGRPEVHFEVKLGGHTVRERDADGRDVYPTVDLGAGEKGGASRLRFRNPYREEFGKENTQIPSGEMRTLHVPIDREAVHSAEILLLYKRTPFIPDEEAAVVQRIPVSF